MVDLVDSVFSFERKRRRKGDKVNIMNCTRRVPTMLSPMKKTMSNNKKGDDRSRIIKKVLRKIVTTMIKIMMTLTTKGLVYNGRILTNSQQPDQIGTTMVAVFFKKNK